MAVEKPLPGVDSLTGVPKRKPVPMPADTTARGLAAWTQFSRKKQLLIIAMYLAVVCLLALFIGLAAGLTVGKRHPNLPLPTSHDGPYHGDLTYYEPALGSCGIASSSTDMTCAISHVLFDAASSGSNANANPLCGLELRLRRNERSVDVKVVDRCVGCKETDLDVSPAVFKQLSNDDFHLGRVSVQWAWLEDSPVS